MAKSEKSDKKDEADEAREDPQFKAARETREAQEKVAEEEPKHARATKMEDNEFTWVELRNNSADIFGHPAYVLDAAAFHSQLDTTKPLSKSTVQSAIDKYMKKEVETG